MRNLVTALLVIFTVLLTTQFIGHLYERIFYNQESILDKDNTRTSEPLAERGLSLKELSMIYADAEKRVRVFESGKSKKELAIYSNSDEPYNKKIKIKEIIISRESDYRMIREIVFFWIAGLLLIAGGSLAYIKFEPWVGAPVVISGFTGMIWKTGPLFFMQSGIPGSSIILNVKLICTAITLAVVILYWYFTKKYIAK